MASIDAFAAAFTELTDTPGSFAGAGLFGVRVNAGATALEFRDLALDFLRLDASNDPLTGQLATQAIVPDATQTRDIGTGALLFRRVNGNLGSFVRGAGSSTIALPANLARGGLLAGTQTGIGTNVHRLEGGSFPAIACVGNAATNNAGGTSTLESTRGGAVAFGSAYAYGTGTALVRASGYSAFCAGYAYGNGSSTLEATGSGALAFGYAHGRSGTGSSIIRSTASGSFAAGFGRCFSGSAQSLIEAGGNGAFASGYARTQSPGGAVTLRATGEGSFAQGSIRSTGAAGEITASGPGAFAQGRALNASIIASAINAVQFGPGTNALADSLQVGGAGLRFKGTAGAPGALQNGDMWVSGGYVYIRSNGISVQI